MTVLVSQLILLYLRIDLIQVQLLPYAKVNLETSYCYKLQLIAIDRAALQQELTYLSEG